MKLIYCKSRTNSTTRINKSEVFLYFYLLQEDLLGVHLFHQSVKPLQTQGSDWVGRPELSRKPENKPEFWSLRGFVL